MPVFSWDTAALVFLAYFVLKWLYTLSMILTVKLRPTAAAHVAVLLFIVSSYGIISFVADWRYILPMCCGGWFGTYVSIRWQQEHPRA